LRDHADQLQILNNKNDDLQMANGRLSTKINMCALQGSLDKLRKRVDVFCEIETVGLLENKYLPKLRDCSNYIDQNMIKMDQLQQIVAKFDQNICNKVNKT
jgi:hypothetical protein